jgi:hypothetical protein
MKNALTRDTSLNIHESATILLKMLGNYLSVLMLFSLSQFTELKWVMTSIVLPLSATAAAVNNTNMYA